MSETAIDSLREAIKTAAGSGAFALDAAFLQAGLGDSTVNVPAGYDASVQAAFQVANAAAFTVSVSPDNVGPVANNTFTVTRASIPFLGSTLQSEATLVFAVTADPDEKQTLVVQIESVPANWTWTNSFAFMGGFPFNQLKVANARFIFSTADGTYPWTEAAGRKVAGGKKQNFFSHIPLPDLVKPVLVLFDGLAPPTGSLDLFGVLDLSAYNGDTVLYPSGTLNAALSNGSFSLLYLKVSNPSVRLTIPPPADPSTAEGADQAPELSVASGISIEGIADDQSPYTLEVAITPPSSQSAFAAAANDSTYRIGLTATGDGPQLTPSSIIALAGSTGSYFSATPPVLQQFLAFVGLQGLALAGKLGMPPTLTSLSVAIGSTKGTSWKPIPDPTGKLDFTITSFYLVWSIQNPFESASRQQSFLFGTTFTLAPEVFKGPNGQGDGIFTVEFNSGLQFYAAFDGTASLSDFLFTLTDGAVSLPSTIQASLSNIRLNLDYNAQSFSFVSGYDVSLAFLEVGGKPIISIADGQVRIAAKTPTQERESAGTTVLSPALVSANGTSGTVWQSEISGLMAVGPLAANVKVGYDGFQTPARWNLNASLARPITVQDLIEQFFNPTGSYAFPDFLPGTLTVKTFAIDAVIPSGKGDLATSYTIDTSFSWLFKLGDQSVGIDPAKIGLAYDGAKPAGQQFSGVAEGTWIYDAINLQLLMGYKFMPTEQGTNNILYLEWEGFRAEYESGKEQITFSLKGWSLGTLIQALVRTLGDPYFTLPAPWNLLDQVSLDGLSVSVSLKSGVQNRLSASYTLSSPINLGFVTIKGLVFRRDTTGKVTLAIDGAISPVLLDSVPPAEKQKLTNLMSPETGQDVRDMPSIPGRGEEYFKLFLLVLGQRIGITGHTGFKNTKDVICALQDVPNTTGKTNPVDPNANQGNPPKGLPYYNQRNNWLIAAHLGLLKVAGAWTVDAMLVFNDPDLYGLRLALAGPKAGGLAGLSVDVLYKKITDDIGVFQIEFTFPDAIRNLNFGTVSITLPEIGIKVYTNGDFFIDVGFPYNLDFRRSFSIAAIVYGVPVLGAGGFYFGKLSNATATQVPKTTKGTFDPVVVFGLGLQLGLGYNFTKGPLSAGFAVTFFGIVEGVIAPWHPYDQSGQSTALVAANGALQSDYYFKLSGTVGVIGLLYGKIDFAIIQASVNVKITLAAQITYESYRAIPLVVLASVDVSVKVKIDLGLFSISISLSFSTTVSAKFVLGSDEPERAPWYERPALAAAYRAALLGAGPDAARRRARLLTPRPKRVTPRAAANPTLTLLAAPQFTVLAPEGATDYQQQEGAFVFLLAMDAPDATQHEIPAGDTSFDRLCASFFPWVIDALGTSEGDVVDLRAAAATTVTRAELEAYIDRLADLDAPAFTIGDLLGFLASSFNLDIATPEQAKTSGLAASMQAGSVLFPVFDGLSLTVPKAAGSGNTPITFETYASATSGYRKTVAEIFAQVEAVIEQQNAEEAARLLAVADDAESMASLIFVDTFTMIGRQLLQAALDALDSYAYKLQPTDSIQEIITWANAAGNHLTPDDVAVPNQDHSLSAGLPLAIDGLTYTIQSGDTLTTIAARYTEPDTSAPHWKVMPGQIIEANGPARILQPGVIVTLRGKDGPVDYTTGPGDSFEQIATNVGITLTELAAQEAVYAIEGLLTPGRPLIVPEFTYTTAGSASASEPSPDTLGSVATLFATTVSRLAAANLDVKGLFSPAAEQGVITLAGLTGLSVGDLWASVQATNQVAQTAGMVSHFLLFGLRLPNEAGLGLSPEFLYPATQHGYGMYQLTGQQFPIPGKLDDGSSYAITLSRATSAHGVDLSFVKLNGTDGTSAPVDLTEAYGRVSVIRDWARSGAFTPAPSFEALPLASRSPKAFPVNTASLWSTSDVAALERLTDRANAVAASGTAAQKQPILWNLPPSLLSVLESRQASLTPLFGSLTDILPLLPQFQPQVGSTSPANHVTSYTDIEHWAWATRVDVQVKRLPQIEALAPDGTGAGSTPAGPASAAPLPNVYELVGPSSEDALRLEQVLSAMDALGEDMASGIFLLYEQPGATRPELLTLGDQEFLSFITQTNLSTETNPERSLRLALAAPQGAPPRGIANPPGEFVKLLWELSVVRSGGYYLYYQVVDGGDGLPASIFDTSGAATLSMVVTYATGGTSSLGRSAPNFVNAFVTTDSIDMATDTVQVLSRDAAGRSAPLSGSASETLRSLATIYGVGPGQIAEANATVPLTRGSVIPVNGIARQLQQGDVTDPTNTLEKLAAYYSVGARTPITAQAIADLNPGVPVQLGAVFAIPAISYIVAPAAKPGTAPGDSFESIARYYGLSIDAAAVCAMGVGGLFPSGTRLDINTQLFDLYSTLGPGNLSFRLGRVNLGEPPELPANPTPEQKAAYARAYLYSLYNSLSAGLAGNPFFEPSPMGLPFGPQDHESGEESEAFASHARAQAKRSLRLRAAAEQDFDYRQTLGFRGFSQINPAPDPDAPGLPPRSENPYIGVGSVAQVALRWQDIFGNTTITPFEQPPASYSGALNGSAASIRYQDRLVGIAAWPNVRVSHIYQGDAGRPELHLNFALDTASYSGNEEQAKRDLACFTRIYFQLHQEYTDLGVPGVTGNAVSMRLHNGLLTDPDLLLSDTQAQVIRDFVSDCVQCLAFIADGSELPPLEPKATLSIPVSLDQVVPDNVIALDVALTFERQVLLTDPSVAALEDGLSVTSAILPQADREGAVAYTVYATAFERAFQTSAWYMKIGEGLRQTASGEDQRSQQLWTVRFGNAKGTGIFFEIGAEPSYYAPRPVAHSLESKTVTIIDYASGRPVQSSFTGVDQNLWFQTCLDAIDTFLSDDFSSAAFILDKILGTNDPLKDGYLGQVLKAKQSLADSISATVSPILSTSATDPSTAWAAREKLRQQLLNQIGTAYAAGAVTVFGLTDVSGAPPETPAGPPNLYGQPTGGISGDAANQNYTLSAARVPLGPITTSDTGEPISYDPRLTFVFSSKNVASQAYVPLDLALKISHLEFDRTSVPGIAGYVQSRWLTFVNGPFDYALGSGTANIPVVNRMLPTPPTVRTQSAQRHTDTPVTAADLVKWDYHFEYLYEQAAQDMVAVTIELNPRQDGAYRLAAERDLFTDLAQFISSYPDVLRDLTTYLTKIDAGTPSDETVNQAKKAVSAFATYTTNLAASYAASIAPRRIVSAVAAPDRVEVNFFVALTQDQDGNAQTDILDLRIGGKPATWDPNTGTISNGMVTLPAVVVEIDPERYQAQAISPPPETVSIAYRYAARPSGAGKTGEFLSYEAALAIPLRTVRLDALNVLVYQSAWSAIYVQRNRLLAPVEELAGVRTTPEFLFQTPVVKFADPIVPRLVYPAFSLDQAAPSNGDGLEEALNRFFEGLFAGGTGKTAVDVSMAGRYSYLLIPLAPRIQLPVSMLTPTEAVVDPSTPPSFTAPFAASIQDWQAANHPTEDGDPQINIQLQVFGASGTNQPIVVVDDLRYPVIRQVPV